MRLQSVCEGGPWSLNSSCCTCIPKAEETSMPYHCRRIRSIYRLHVLLKGVSMCFLLLESCTATQVWKWKDLNRAMEWVGANRWGKHSGERGGWNEREQKKCLPGIFPHSVLCRKQSLVGIIRLNLQRKAGPIPRRTSWQLPPNLSKRMHWKIMWGVIEWRCWGFTFDDKR